MTCGTWQINKEYNETSYLYVSYKEVNLKEQAQKQEEIKMYASRIVCMDNNCTEMWQDKVPCNNGPYHGDLSYIPIRSCLKSLLNIDSRAHTAAIQLKKMAYIT